MKNILKTFLNEPIVVNQIRYYFASFILTLFCSKQLPEHVVDLLLPFICFQLHSFRYRNPRIEFILNKSINKSGYENNVYFNWCIEILKRKTSHHIVFVSMELLACLSIYH